MLTKKNSPLQPKICKISNEIVEKPKLLVLYQNHPSFITLGKEDKNELIVFKHDNLEQLKICINHVQSLNIKK